MRTNPLARVDAQKHHTTRPIYRTFGLVLSQNESSNFQHLVATPDAHILPHRPPPLNYFLQPARDCLSLPAISSPTFPFQDFRVMRCLTGARNLCSQSAQRQMYATLCHQLRQMLALKQLGHRSTLGFFSVLFTKLPPPSPSCPSYPRPSAIRLPAPIALIESRHWFAPLCL